MKLKLILTTAIVGAALALPGSAWAQAPPNDTFEQATVIPSLPFSQVLNTTQATIDSTDAEALAACDLPFPVSIAASVWYEYTPPADQSLFISTSGSSYSTGVGVLTGSPGSLSAVTCFQTLASFSLTAGVTYHIVVSDVGAAQLGGTLNLTAAPGVEFKVDRFGRFDPKTGVATVTGKYTCPSGFTAQISGSLTQRTMIAVTGGNLIFLPCNGAVQQWSIAFTEVNFGKFRGGPAHVSLGFFAGSFPGGLSGADQTIILRGKG
jgi:hypothetical protein